MKFYDNHRKWAMTGVLLAVLGFNISPPKAMKSFNLTDMASTDEVKEGKFTSADGTYKVKYSKSGDDTIGRISKVYDTESGSTADCVKCSEERAIIIPKNFQSNLDDLNQFAAKAVAKEMSDSNRGAERVKATQEDKSEKDRPDKKDTKLAKADKEKSVKTDAVQKLSDAVDQCKDENETTADITQCISDEAISIFEDADRKSIDSAKLTAILTKEMILPLGESLSDIRDDEQYSYANRTMMMAKMKEVLQPLSSLMNNASVSKTQTSKDLKERYNLLVKASLQDAKAAWDNKDTTSFQYRSDDLKMWSAYMAGSNIYNKGINEANQMSANLQNQIATSLCSMTNAAGNCGSTSGSDQIVVDGQVYSRVGGSAGRGGITNPQMNTTGVASVPNVVLQQNSQGGMAIIIPNGQNGSTQYNSMQPMNTTSVNGVPMQVLQQQAVPSTPQYYQTQQMYSQPVYNTNQYNASQYNPYSTQYTVPQTTTGGVVNMGTYRTGTTGTTASGVGIVPRQ